MSSLYITTRSTSSGRRYVVRYRLGGRAYPVEHGGSFKTLKEARGRRDLIAGEISAGRNPRDVLRPTVQVPPATVTLHEWADRFLASRIDFAKNTADGYR